MHPVLGEERRKNMKTNICTTQDQSARLLKCGVSTESADMTLSYCKGGFYELMATPFHYGCFSEEDAPAWSLSALLSIMPDLEHCFSLWKFEEDDTYAADATMVNPDFRVDANDPIEACVGLIEILHANGYKLNEQ